MTNILIQTLKAWLPPGMAPLAAKAVGLAIILFIGVVVAIAVSFVFRRAERVMLSRRLLPEDPRGEYAKRVSTLLKLLRTISLAIVWCIVVVTLLGYGGLDITPILASAGIVGLAVGFGAQSLVRDILNGFFHILENQIRVGDVAEINGVGGVVEQITYRIIVLRDLQQAVHVFPHGRVATLTNFTKDISAMLVDVGVAYKEHPDTVIAALRDVAQTMTDDPAWSPKLLKPLEVLGLDKFDDSAVVFRVRFMTLPIEQWGVKREFQRRLKIEFDRRGIEFPFPHRTLYLADGSAPLRVQVLADEAAAPGAAPNAAGEPTEPPPPHAED